MDESDVGEDIENAILPEDIFLDGRDEIFRTGQRRSWGKQQMHGEFALIHAGHEFPGKVISDYDSKQENQHHDAQRHGSVVQRPDEEAVVSRRKKKEQRIEPSEQWSRESAEVMGHFSE